MKHITLKHIFTALLLIIGLQAKYFAQSTCLSPKEVMIPSSLDNNENQAYSPSITNYVADGTVYLVSAYAYTSPTTANTREVAISTSTDDGTSWVPNSTILSKPHHTSDNTELENVDDPQILTIDPGYLVLVVRAWAKDATAANGVTTMEGLEYLEQLHSIFKKCGIYFCSSTDGGQTWGSWSAVDEVTPGTDGRTTLENPRISWRRDYYLSSWISQVGYITWEKKVFSLTNGYYEVDKTNTKIGIAAFNTDPTNLSLIKNTANKIAFYPSLTNASGGASLSGPERPSITIAPDNTFYISFYTINYPSRPSQSNPYDQELNCDMQIFLFKGFGTVNNSTGKISYTTGGAVEVQPDVSKKTIGNFDFDRGYIYAGKREIIDPLSDETADFCIDFMAGPSIQTVSNYKSTSACDYKYWVAIAYSSQFDDLVYTTYHHHCRVSFNSYSAPREAGNETAHLTQMSFDPDVHKNNAQLNDKEHVANMQFFPVLKYTTSQSSCFTDYPSSQSSNPGWDLWFVRNSFFVLAYMGAERLTTDGNPKCFKYCACLTGVSMDNKTFRCKSYDPTKSDKTILLRSEDYQTNQDPNPDQGFVNPRNGFWGTKIDVTGEEFLFEIHPAWHHIMPNKDMTTPLLENANEILRTNLGHGILVKAYLRNFLATDPAAFPADDGFLTSNTGGLFAGDIDNGNSLWGDYNYFDFNDCSRPTAVTPVATIPSTITSLAAYAQFHPLTGNDEFIPRLGSSVPSPFPYGFYIAMYESENSNNTGILDFSDQRKLVTAGDSDLHAVYARSENGNNNVFYNHFFGNINSSNTFTFQTEFFSLPYNLGPAWGQEVRLNSSGANSFRPAIGIYQEGNENGDGNFDGTTAIGMTWVEFANGLISIKFRTREYIKNSCSWSPWSAQYTVHQHAAASDDGTTPVIAPFVTPKGISTKSSNLLGWNIVWNSPRPPTSPPPVCTNPPNNDVMSPWTGLYSRMWLRVNPSTHFVTSDNSTWGIYGDPASGDYTNGVGFQPQGNINPSYNTLLQPNNCNDPRNPIGFPTITSTDCKFNSSPNYNHARNDFYDFDIGFSTTGDKVGVWVFNVDYNRSGTSIGSIASNPTATVNIGDIQPLPNMGYIQERNPCITINSSGQSFVSWEKIYMLPSMQTGVTKKSEIRIARKPFGSDQWALNTANNQVNIQTVWSEDINSMTWEWLRNPSINGYPRTHLNQKPIPNFDEDLGVVDMTFWIQNCYFTGNGNGNNQLKSTINGLNSFFYSESPGSPNGNGLWSKYNIISTSPAGNAQRSMGMYEAGTPSQGPTPQPNSSYSAGNTILTGNIPSNSVVFHTLGSYKGTFDTLLPYNLYRGENIVLGSSELRFMWGKVYVGDTASSLPMRQVMLHWGFDSTIREDSLNQVRDAMFRTEVFDLPVGANIRYWRGLFSADSLIYTLSGPLSGSSKGIIYTIELVYENGAIDTIERLSFRPYYGLFIQPKGVTITNFACADHNVFLRIRGQIMTDYSQFLISTLEDIKAYNDYPSVSDTSFILYKKGYLKIGSANELLVANPFPVPAFEGIKNITVPVYFDEGYPVTLEVFDNLGRSYVRKIITGNGSWQNIPLSAPDVTGTYFVHISAGNSQKTVTFTIVK